MHYKVSFYFQTCSPMLLSSIFGRWISFLCTQCAVNRLVLWGSLWGHNRVFELSPD